ncbi:MAG TPA: N-acetylmuramoyl-L-alanine amidase [Polyangiaceae bacterium]|nr:N-acetylmuramoyl-L-alanine amidase [Polyangiaceae bacterium]
MPFAGAAEARRAGAGRQRDHSVARPWSEGLQWLAMQRLVRCVLVAAVCLVVAGPIRAAEEGLAPEPAQPTITKVERYTADDAARIVLHVSRPVQFQKSESPASAGAPASLDVDLFDATYAGQHGFETQGLVRRVRLMRVGSAYRVAIDTSAPARHTAFYLPDPFRIVIDVTRREARKRSPGNGRKVERVALDPGHGGVDPGATGAGGTREKDVVLDIAHRAAPLLARELGVSALLTRDTDVRVPLEERVARANAFGADLFISIHCNAERSRSVRGVMTFVLDGSHGHAGVGLLEQENASRSPDAAELSRFLEQFDDAATAERSTTFALLLQRSTLASLAAGYPEALDGGVHGAGFYVLVGARMPAVLFETSFVSNTLEERRLGTERYRQKLADAIVNAVRAYRAGYPASAGRRTQPSRDPRRE